MPSSLVYAYGSNLCMGRMLERAPSAQPLETAELRRHRLCFHKRGRDGSGKADAYFTGRQSDSLWGIVFRMNTRDARALDRYEGEGSHYDRVRRRVWAVDGGGWDGGGWDVWLYRARAERIVDGLEPFEWYKELLVEGARAGGLPLRYIRTVAAVTSRVDPDRGRALRELRALNRSV